MAYIAGSRCRTVRLDYMRLDFANYPMLIKLNANSNYDLVLFSSCYSEEKQFPDILGREIFLFDKNDKMI